jgi:PAS domain S-box-containing protein
MARRHQTDSSQNNHQRDEADPTRERLALAIEGANDGLWDWDIVANTVYYSPRWKAMLGYRDDEIANDFDEWTRRIHPDDRDRCLAAIQEHLNSPDSAYRLEHRVRHKDGSYRWILTRAASLRDASGRAYRIAGWHTDITERRARASQVKERERQYHDIFTSTSDGLILNDLDTGHVVEANPAACAMHGYIHKDFVGLHPTAFIAPEYHDAFERYMQAAREGRAFRTHAIDVRRDGSRLHVEIHGSTIAYGDKTYVLGVVRDISERVRYYEELERRVRQRTQELTTLLDISRSVSSNLELQPLLRTVLDRLKTVVDYTGAAIIARQDDDDDTLALLDYRGPASGADIETLERSPTFQEVLRNFLDAHEARVVGDVRSDEPGAAAFRRAAGAYLDTEFAFVHSWMGLPLIAKERVIGMLNIVHAEPGYFTERHVALAMAVAGQAAVALENARLYEEGKDLAALEERQRLARELHDSVSQALYGITLGARTARALLDRDPARAAEPLDYALSLAEAALAEMRTLIFELRPESLANEGLIVALEKLATAARARHHIEVNMTLMDEPAISLDAKQALYRIAQEALQNVVRHARATEVTLRLSQKDGDELTLDIRDNGVGFDPSGSFPGRLGLNSMRERVVRLGGVFTLESLPDQGTHLMASIPLAAAEGSSDPAPETSTRSASSQ